MHSEFCSCFNFYCHYIIVHYFPIIHHKSVTNRNRLRKDKLIVVPVYNMLIVITADNNENDFPVFDILKDYVFQAVKD